jgi:DNA-binding GntR family transcriptional regulator
MAATSTKRSAATTLRTPDARVSALGIARDTARAIERGDYKPGDRIREQALADRFQCSRAPVREALRILESQGIVVIEPMKGARIASIDDASFYEVFLIRRALAGLMAQRAAAAADADEKMAFLKAARRLPKLAGDTTDGHAFAAEVRNVTGLFRDCASLPRTAQIVRNLTFGHHAFQDQILESRKSRKDVARLWSELADRVETQDTDDARKTMEALFDHAFAFMTQTKG